MKKWQEERNYRRVRNEGGEVIANIITVDGMDVEVPEDVYLAYAQADRRERYIMEEQSSGKLLSLEQMEEDALLPDYVGAETAPSAETEALEREELRNLAEQKQILLLALLSLKDTDRELINALFFDGASTRDTPKEWASASGRSSSGETASCGISKSFLKIPRNKGIHRTQFSGGQ